MVRDVNVGQVYEGWYTSGSRCHTRRKVTARTGRFGSDTVDWQSWSVELGTTTGDTHVCSIKSFLQWAKEHVTLPEDVHGMPKQVSPSPATHSPNRRSWGGTPGKLTTIGVSQTSPTPEFVDWNDVLVGEMFTAGDRLLLGVDHWNRGACSEGATALLDVRTLELFRSYDDCCDFNLVRVSAEITINVR